MQQFSLAQNAMKNGKKDGVWNYYGSNKALLARHFYDEGVKRAYGSSMILTVFFHGLIILELLLRRT
jgi:hypothetical protein